MAANSFQVKWICNIEYQDESIDVLCFHLEKKESVFPLPLHPEF